MTIYEKRSCIFDNINIEVRSCKNGVQGLNQLIQAFSGGEAGEKLAPYFKFGYNF